MTSPVVLRGLWDDLLALAFPSNCVGCGRNDRLLCRGCRNELTRLTNDPPLTTTQLSVHASTRAQISVTGACEYRGLPRRLLTAIKHSDQPGLARHLAPLLQAGLTTAATQHENRAVYIPVPSRASRERERGYRHVDLLLRHAGIPRRNISHVITTTRGRGPQVGRDLQARYANAAKLKVNHRRVQRLKASGAPAVIVDDITTTGASLAAAARVLIENGIDIKTAVVVCRVSRLDQRKPKETAKE